MSGDPADYGASGNVAGQRFSMQQLPDLRENRRADDDLAEAGDDEIARNRAEFTTVYDIIDALEEKLEEAKGTVFSPGVVKIDRDEFTEQLESLKSKLPVQLERASALMREAEHRLETAQSQANVIITTAQSRSADMVKEAQQQAQILAGHEHVTEIARQKARQILDEAQAKADKLTHGADRYCITMMEELQGQLGKYSHDVQSGLTVLKDRQQEASEDLPHLQPGDYPQG
ncbi:cell division protein [Bifidobacterium choloepi]|nr:cell division protein [Bifidobacterium choloepi]